MATGKALKKLQEQIQLKEPDPENKIKTVMDIFDSAEHQIHHRKSC